MASVVDIAPPRPAPSPSFRKIRAASRGLEVLFTGLFVVFILVALFSLWILLFYQGDVRENQIRRKRNRQNLFVIRS